MSIQCRTCAEKIFNPNAKNLFEQDDNEILLNIEILTGIKLTEEQHMPKHICTCCHLDLYHSIAFRDRCLKTDQFLQSANQKTITLDPLKTEAKAHAPNEPLNQPQYAIKISRSKDLLLNMPDKGSLNRHSSQSRILRARKQNLSMLTKKSIRIRNKFSLALHSDENASDQHEAHELKKSPPGSPSNCEESCSTSVEEDENELSGFEGTSDFNEGSLKAESPDPSTANSCSVAQLLPEQDNETVIRKKYKPSGETKVFICDLCGHQSSNPKNLDIHILRHKGEKNFECTECGTKHYSKYLLQLHIRVKHQGEMPFECRFCGQRFYSGSTRQRHEQVRHIRSWSYECKICGKKYNTKSCLNKHEFLHSGLRPYRCDVCNVAFPRKPGLRIHCRTKQHQKRASEALNSNQLGDLKEMAVSDEAIIFPNSLIVELDA